MGNNKQRLDGNPIQQTAKLEAKYLISGGHSSSYSPAICNTCGLSLGCLQFSLADVPCSWFHNILVSSPKLQTKLTKTRSYTRPALQDFLWNLGASLFYSITNPCILHVCETVPHGQLQVPLPAWDVVRPPFPTAQAASNA